MKKMSRGMKRKTKVVILPCMKVRNSRLPEEVTPKLDLDAERKPTTWEAGGLISDNGTRAAVLWPQGEGQLCASSSVSKTKTGLQGGRRLDEYRLDDLSWWELMRIIYRIRVGKKRWSASRIFSCSVKLCLAQELSLSFSFKLTNLSIPPLELGFF